MIRKLLVLSLLVGMVGGVYAEPSVKVVSSRTWTTGDVRGGEIKSRIDSGARGGDVYATAFESEGWEPGNTYGYGTHSCQLSNPSPQTKRILVEYKLCMDNHNCIYKNETVDIASKAIAGCSASSTIVGYFDKPGVYDLDATTNISGDMYGVAKGHAYVTIHKR